MNSLRTALMFRMRSWFLSFMSGSGTNLYGRATVGNCGRLCEAEGLVGAAPCQPPPALPPEGLRATGAPPRLGKASSDRGTAGRAAGPAECAVRAALGAASSAAPAVGANAAGLAGAETARLGKASDESAGMPLPLALAVEGGVWNAPATELA
jgi:hypothetical protein